MNNLQLKRVAQSCYLALIILIPVWLYLKPNPFSIGWSLLPWWIPLLPAVKGILKGHYYTMTWANFVLIIPFSHGWMMFLASVSESHFGLAELIFSSGYYVSYLTLAKRIKKAQKLQQSESVQPTE